MEIIIYSTVFLTLFKYINNQSIAFLILSFSLAEKLCKSSYSSWECYGACTSEEKEGSPPGAVTPREKCSCGRSNGDRSSVSRRSVNKRTSFPRTHSVGQKSLSNSWRPLLLFIPLRLGLSEINSAYYPALKVNIINCF